MASKRRSPSPSTNNQQANSPAIAIIITAMTVIGGIIGSYITSSINNSTGQMIGRQTAIAEVQPTVNALQATIAAPTPVTMIGSAQTITVTEILQVTPTPDSNNIRIELIPGEAYPFFGTQNPEVLQGTGTLFIGFDNNGTTLYKFNYNIPDEGPAYAGFSYQFKTPLNIAAFNTIELKITYEDPSAKAQISLSDIAGRSSYIRLADGFVNGREIDHSGNERTQVISIPIALNFSDVDKQAVRFIGFGADASFTRGNRTFIVQDIKLIR